MYILTLSAPLVGFVSDFDCSQLPRARAFLILLLFASGRSQLPRTRTIAAFNLGYETMASGWAIDTMASYSFAEEDDSNNAEANFRTKYRNDDKITTINWADPQRPLLTPADNSLYDPAEMGFDSFESTANVSKDSEVAFVFNAEKEFDIGVVKAGVKAKSREKDVDDYIIVYDGWGDNTLADMNPQTNSDWFFANQTFSQQADPDMVWAIRDLVSEMDLDFEDDSSRDFTTTEDIFAAYVQNTYQWEKGVVIAGVRYENTSVDSQAYDAATLEQTTASSDHSFFAPSVNVKYFFNDQLQLRAAIWKGLSRPGFKKTAPKLDVDYDDGGTTVSGSAGNPLLKPYEAVNYDLSLEFYGEGMTFLSAGLFRKDIKNAIYPTLQENATIMGISFNDGVETWINADDSTINGFELNGQYGWENGMYVTANITLTDGESTFAYEDDQTFTTPFRKLADEAANVSIGYDKGPWDIRLAANYRSEYLDWLADENEGIDDVSENNMRWVDVHLQPCLHPPHLHTTSSLTYHTCTKTTKITTQGDADIYCRYLYFPHRVCTCRLPMPTPLSAFHGFADVMAPHPHHWEDAHFFISGIFILECFCCPCCPIFRLFSGPGPGPQTRTPIGFFWAHTHHTFGFFWALIHISFFRAAIPIGFFWASSCVHGRP